MIDGYVHITHLGPTPERLVMLPGDLPAFITERLPLGGEPFELYGMGHGTRYELIQMRSS